MDFMPACHNRRLDKRTRAAHGGKGRRKKKAKHLGNSGKRQIRTLPNSQLRTEVSPVFVHEKVKTEGEPSCNEPMIIGIRHKLRCSHGMNIIDCFNEGGLGTETSKFTSVKVNTVHSTFTVKRLPAWLSIQILHRVINPCVQILCLVVTGKESLLW